jgi:RimJ/RimL family protein N-acetyltransferase
MNRELETERLLLRPFRQSDAGAVQALCGNRKVARMTSRIPHPFSEELAAQWIASHGPARVCGEENAFCLEKGGTVIGAVGYMNAGDDVYEIGYWLGEPWWGRGFATEAVRCLIGFIFDDLGAHRLTSGHVRDNPASGQVLEKCGFAYTGEEEQWCEARGRQITCRRLALAREEAQRPRATP